MHSARGWATDKPLTKSEVTSPRRPETCFSDLVKPDRDQRTRPVWRDPGGAALQVQLRTRPSASSGRFPLEDADHRHRARLSQRPQTPAASRESGSECVWPEHPHSARDTGGFAGASSGLAPASR